MNYYRPWIDHIVELYQSGKDYRFAAGVLADEMDYRGDCEAACTWHDVYVGCQWIDRVTDDGIYLTGGRRGEAIRPPLKWRQPSVTWPDPPTGYELLVVGSRAANGLHQRWGVRPAHVSQCTYALWVPCGEHVHDDAPIIADARRWLADGGIAAEHVCQRDYPFGRQRILNYAADEMGVPIPQPYTLRMSDLSSFLDAAKSLTEASPHA